MANEIIKTQLHPQKPADETDIIYPETSADQVKGLPTTNETEKKTVVMNRDGYSLMPYNAPTQVRVGETQTLPEGYQASVQNVGTPEAPVLNFQIPQGKTGPQGPTGKTGVGGQTFYILSHDIRNGVGDVTLSVPTSEFEPAIEAVEGGVVRGVSQPSGALFSALPDYSNGVFAGTFTVTTLGYAGVAHGGTIDKTLDINANVHIGRGNTDAKLYVREIRFDKVGDENGKIEINSQTLFRSKINLETSIYSEFGEGSIIDLPYGGIVADRIRAITSIQVPKLRVNRISKTGDGDLTLDAQIDAGNHRIFNCKINTNRIKFHIEGLTDKTLTLTNMYDDVVASFTANGNYTSTFPCIVSANSSFTISSGRKVYIIDDSGFHIVGAGYTITNPAIIFLGNYGKPSDDDVVDITFNFSIR